LFFTEKVNEEEEVASIYTPVPSTKKPPGLLELTVLQK